MSLADVETAAPDGCLAYGIYYYEGIAERTHGEHSDLVLAANGHDPDGLTVVWVFSEEMAAQDGCAYCRNWTHAPVCPGVWEHAKHAFARMRDRIAWHDLEIGLFLVPFDLTPSATLAEILRQIRTGVTYAVAS